MADRRPSHLVRRAFANLTRAVAPLSKAEQASLLGGLLAIGGDLLGVFWLGANALVAILIVVGGVFGFAGLGFIYLGRRHV
jgi:hypothetical protein